MAQPSKKSWWSWDLTPDYSATKPTGKSTPSSPATPVCKGCHGGQRGIAIVIPGSLPQAAPTGMLSSSPLANPNPSSGC